MKILNCLVAVVMICGIHAGPVQAQCTSGFTSTLLSYDSTVIGVGSSPYVFTFPKFDATLGTLTSVRIQSVVTLLYTVSIENTEADTREVEHYLNRL
ncbi:MAG TPA: choice-of-anchor E domain-containing protein, partial [Flavitalea sp.]|nr:choice-of-anchor E domain-containing protein [Flavitalea sp.]